MAKLRVTNNRPNSPTPARGGRGPTPSLAPALATPAHARNFPPSVPPRRPTARGGQGANQAVAAAKMGAPVAFAGVFGGDSHGTMLRATMDEAGVDTSLSTVSAGPNGQAIIVLEPTGANTILLVPGANNDWDVELPDGLLKSIEGSSCVMLQREIPERINIAVAQHAKKCGVDVLMDVGGDDSPLPTEMLECITMCAPNETELQNLTEMPTSTREEILLAAKKLQEYGVNKVLVTLGKDGSMVLMESGEVITQGALPLYDGGKVVDTTGAGDCFRGAFAVALSRSQTVQVSPPLSLFRSAVVGADPPPTLAYRRSCVKAVNVAHTASRSSQLTWHHHHHHHHHHHPALLPHRRRASSWERRRRHCACRRRVPCRPCQRRVRSRPSWSAPRRSKGATLFFFYTTCLALVALIFLFFSSSLLYGARYVHAAVLGSYSE